MKNILSIFLMGITLTTTAQKDKMRPLITHSIGGSFQEFEGLNARLVNYTAFEPLKEYGGTLGLGWIKNYKGVIASGNVNLGSTMSGDRDKKSSAMRFYAFTFDLGYDVLKSDRLMLYPFVGVGYQKYQAVFYRDNTSVPFDSVLNSPATRNSISSVKFNNPFLVYRAGIGFSIRSPRHESKSIGIVAGYTGSFKEHAWRSNEDQLLSNAPIDKVSQFFVSLVLTSSPMFMKDHK